jgi:hypothetical protein
MSEKREDLLNGLEEHDIGREGDEGEGQSRDTRGEVQGKNGETEMESNMSRAKGDRENIQNHPIYSMVISRPAMEFPNRARLTRAVSGASQMGLRARGDAYASRLMMRAIRERSV